MFKCCMLPHSQPSTHSTLSTFLSCCFKMSSFYFFLGSAYWGRQLGQWQDVSEWVEPEDSVRHDADHSTEARRGKEVLKARDVHVSHLQDKRQARHSVYHRPFNEFCSVHWGALRQAAVTLDQQGRGWTVPTRRLDNLFILFYFLSEKIFLIFGRFYYLILIDFDKNKEEKI